MFMILNSLMRSLETVLAMQALLIIFTETVETRSKTKGDILK